MNYAVFKAEAYLFVKIHEQKSSNFAHTLAVSNLRVVHGICRQDVKQSLLPVRRQTGNVASIKQNISTNF